MMVVWKHKVNGATVERDSSVKMLAMFWEKVESVDNISEDEVVSIEDNPVEEVVVTDSVEEDTPEEEGATPSVINLSLSEDQEVSLYDVNSDLLSFKTYESYSQVCAEADKELPAFVDGVEYKHDGSRWRKQ